MMSSSAALKVPVVSNISDKRDGVDLPSAHQPTISQQVRYIQGLLEGVQAIHRSAGRRAKKGYVNLRRAQYH